MCLQKRLQTSTNLFDVQKTVSDFCFGEKKFNAKVVLFIKLYTSLNLLKQGCFTGNIAAYFFASRI